MNKLKMNKKNIFRILYILLIISNILFLFFLIPFINNYLYRSIILDENYLLQNKKTNVVNINKFNSNLKKLKEKQTKEQLNLKDIFN